MKFQIPRLLGFKVGIFWISPIALEALAELMERFITANHHKHISIQKLPEMCITETSPYKSDPRFSSNI